ncbi:MAG: response regulator transcription factor [Chloroflexi bacterium]|nr:response regulator transcription factor [Chloroflexota bacterium]
MGQQTTVLIADGHEMMRESMGLILSRDSAVRVVGVAADGQAAVTMAAAIHPDVAILDIGLPRINGIEAGRQIRQMAPATGLVLLSAHDRAEYMKEFFRDDSVGKAFLLKGNLSSTRDLVRTIQDVAVGRTVLDPTMVTKLTTNQNVRVGSRLKGLTNRELQVLALMAKAHSNKAVAEILYIQPRTVEHHISSILAKLGFNSDGESHGRVHAVLTYLDATGQLPLKSSDLPDATGRDVESSPARTSQDMPPRISAFSPIPRRAA